MASKNSKSVTNSDKDAPLQQQVDELKKQVFKQKKVLMDTAQQLLALQLKKSREELAAIPNPDALKAGDANKSKTGSSDSIDTSDFATNEDLVQIVGELQGQLTLLDQRSQNRVANSMLHEDKETIEPIPNADGVPAPKKIYPATVKDYKSMDGDQLIELCAYYELLPATAEDEARMKAFMAGKIKSPNVPASEFKPKAEDYSKEALEKLKEDLRKFLGMQKFNH